MSANIEQIKAMLERMGKTNLPQKQKVDLNKEKIQLEAAYLQTIKEFIEKGKRCEQQAVEDNDQENYIFWGGFRNCAENILREVEESAEEIKGNLEEIPSNVNLEKEIKKHTDLFQADIEYPLRLTAIKFYELGLKARKEE